MAELLKIVALTLVRNVFLHGDRGEHGADEAATNRAKRLECAVCRRFSFVRFV
jgi:hypothetical protein